jgi:5-methylthioadenosine/S-adenosylhomocysteine deaminase
VAVAHCPKSNAKTGCGVAPLPDLLRLGVRVGFGTDSPASSNIMDMFDEMRTALFLHRGVARDVTVLNAAQCVRIATLGGAEALGLADRVGSLEPGKQADLIAVDVSGSHFVPIDDPYSALVYGANQDDVLFTCVAGAPLYSEGRFARLDADAVRGESRKVRAKLQARVRGGDVRVGAAESGWWRTTPANDTRES